MSRIALFISSLTKGGAERVMVNLAASLKEAGDEVLLVTQYQAQEEYPLPAGITRVYSELTPEEESGRIRNFFARIQKLRAIWKKYRPQVILSFIGKNNVMAILTAAGLHIPVVVSVRSDPEMEYPIEDPVLRRSARLLFRRAAGVVLMTEKSREFFPAAVQKKAIVMPNPLNPVFMQKAPSGSREPLIVSIGRLDENKNQAMMIRAFADLSEDFPEYRLELYGDGPLRQALEQQIVQSGLSGRVALSGVTAHPEEVLSRASLFLLTSGFEGVSNALLEAMAMGVPCIATDCPCGGSRDVIGAGGERGILIPVGDEDALEEAMRRVLTDPEEAFRIGQKGAEYVRERHDPQRVAKLWIEYLHGIKRN